MLGAKVVLVAPPTLLPIGVQSWPAEVSYDFDSVIGEVDAVIMLRMQIERMTEMFIPNAREYSRFFGLDWDRLATMKSNAIVMHPGPMNRGVEIDSAVADGNQSVILNQVTFGIAIRMAVMSIVVGK